MLNDAGPAGVGLRKRRSGNRSHEEVQR
jgi:hypothetical protein